MFQAPNVVHAVFSAKNKIVENNRHIEMALKSRTPIVAARLQKQNADLRKKIYDMYGVIINY